MSPALIDSASAFTTALVLLAGGFSCGVVFHVFAARHRDHRGDHALLAILCCSAGAYLVLESCLYRSHDIATHGLLRRCEQLAGAPFMIAYPLYLAGIARLSRRAVGLVAAGVTAITLAATAVSGSGLWLMRIDHLQEFQLPWGEVLMLARGPASPWMYHSLASWLAMCGFGTWCALRHRRDPAAIGVAALIAANSFFFIALVHDSLLDLGMIRSVFISEFTSPLLAGAVWLRVAIAERRHMDAWRLLFARAGDAILVHDLASGRLVEANDAATTLLSRSRADLRSHGLAVALSDGGAEEAGLLALVSANGSALVERLCRDRTGRDFPAEIALRATMLEDRPRVVASIRDLSQRRIAERSLVANERRLRQVIDRCPIAIAESGPDDGRPSCNSSFGALLGPDPDTALPAQVWPPRHRSDEPKRDAGGLSSNRVAVRDADGKMHQLDVASVLAGSRTVTFITDLTDILDARDRLAEREALHRAVIEEASDGVILVSTRPGRKSAEVMIWNRRMEEITQRRAADADGDPRLTELLARGVAGERDVVLELPDGSVRACVVSSTEVPGPIGTPRALTIVRDVTELRQAEEQRRQLEAQAEWIQQFESMGVLAGGIAHDYNNLLMAILGQSGLISVTLAAGDAQSRSDLRDIEQAAQRAADLCRQMLAYAGKGTGGIGVVDVDALVSGMDRMLEISVAKKITLARDLSGSRALVKGDASQLRQVIINLVTNASEAFADRSGNIRIRIGSVTLAERVTMAAGTSLPPGPYVAIEVVDDGDGMDADTVQRVFEPFFTTKFTGRGLGLAVVLGIVRAHAGGIGIISAPQAGTTVRVLLPASDVPAPPSTPAPAAARPSMTALVVDDDPSIRAITAEMLALLGYAVRVAASGAEAIAAFAGSAPPGTVILDLSLPDLSGEDVLRTLRSLAPRSRFIMVSGYGRDDIERLLGPAGAHAILTKPFDLDALLAALGADSARSP